jgi:outer membrane lipoprotein-sorting protein
MLRKYLPGVALGTLLAIAGQAQAQTADELVAKNIAARGGLDKLKAVQTVRMTGKMTMGPMEAPFTLEMKRPKNLRAEFVVQGMTGVQAYDGKTAWFVMPFMGKKDPEVAPADETKQADEQADFDGPLVDYKTKGNTVELVGKEKVEGTDVYKLKVTLKGGEVRYLYLESDSFLEIKTEAKRTVRGNDVEFESSIGDYKEISGLMIPFSIENSPKGSPQKQKITFDKVEFNVPIEDTRFKMPEVKAEPPATEPKKPEEKKPEPKKPGANR